jgi:hypothetical protein
MAGRWVVNGVAFNDPITAHDHIKNVFGRRLIISTRRLAQRAPSAPSSRRRDLRSELPRTAYQEASMRRCKTTHLT